MKWEARKERLYNPMDTFHELISIRDGYQECIGFIRIDIAAYISNMCTHKKMIYCYHSIYII